MRYNYVFLSHALGNDTPLYGGADDLKFEPASSIESGDTANTLLLRFPNHAGTHVDVPYHFFKNGKKLTDYNVSFWIFDRPQLIDVSCEDGYLVAYSDISSIIRDETDLLLIRTGYEKYRFEPEYWQKNPGLSANLAINLRLNHSNIRAVGVDVISATSRLNREEGRKTHREFLGSQYDSAPIVLIEDMSLVNYPNNISTVVVVPLMIAHADGAPCTIIGVNDLGK